jgi:hypothetical protein
MPSCKDMQVWNFCVCSLSQRSVFYKLKLLKCRDSYIRDSYVRYYLVFFMPMIWMKVNYTNDPRIIIYVMLVNHKRWECKVGIVTSWKTAVRFLVWARFISFFKISIPAWEPNQPVLWTPGLISQGGKVSGAWSWPLIYISAKAKVFVA